MKDIKEFENKILCGDCLEVMKEIPNNSIDLIITSPPYNTGSRNDCMINAKYKEFDDNKTEEEYINWTLKIFKVLEDKIKDKGVICYNMSYSTAFPNLHYKTIFKIMQETKFEVFDTIIWKKKTAVPLNSHKTYFIIIKLLHKKTSIKASL
jgi:DNA modification methylase